MPIWTGRENDFKSRVIKGNNTVRVEPLIQRTESPPWGFGGKNAIHGIRRRNTTHGGGWQCSFQRTGLLYQGVQEAGHHKPKLIILKLLNLMEVLLETCNLFYFSFFLFPFQFLSYERGRSSLCLKHHCILKANNLFSRFTSSQINSNFASGQVTLQNSPIPDLDDTQILNLKFILE